MDGSSGSGRQTARWIVMVGAAVLALIFGLYPTASVQAQSGGVPRFDPAACSELKLETPAGLMQGLTLECGWLTVPETHANPSGPTLKLAVAVIKSPAANPAPDPVVMMQGGPGGSTIDIYTQIIPLNPRLRSLNRDIVLFDQRGTEYSKPSLFCQAYFDETIRQLNEDISKAESNQRAQAAIKTCYDEFTRQGINLSAFDTVENAADVEDLRQAMGYQQINLYGVSYGTEVALEFSRSYPQSLRSVIIDSVLPPQVPFIENAPQANQRALEAVFNACAGEARCNAAYPNLKTVFYQTADRLNQTKAKIQLKEPRTGQIYPALMDGDTFINGIVQMLYVTDMVPLVPRVIFQIRDGDYRFIENILALTYFDKSISMGMYFSVVCSEDTQIDAQAANLSNLPPQLKTLEQQMVQQMAQTCGFWKVEPVDPAARQAVESSVPTLVLSGAFDPATPPAYGQEAAKTLANHYAVVFPIGGHGQLSSGPCQDSVFIQFLNNPAQAPDTTCAAEQKMAFSAPGDLVRLPQLINLLNLQGAALIELAVYALALLFVLSALAVYPVAWIVSLIRKPAQPVTAPLPAASAPFAPTPAAPPLVGPARRPLLYRLAPWMAALTGPALLAIMVAVYVIGFQMALKNDSRVLMGLPGYWRPLFILPLVAAVLTLVLLIAAAQAWVRRAGSMTGRIYLSLLAAAALVCVVILGLWGILTAILAG